MKTKKLLSALFLTASVFAIFSCNDPVEMPNQDSSILPERFKVDIPASLSSDVVTNGRTAGIDTLQGNAIYRHLGTFIEVGKSASEIVEDIIRGIAIYHINKPMSLSFESNDDGMVKNLEVVKDASYDGRTWEFQLTITDAQSESQPDRGNGLQIFWNRQPIKGVAIFKPSNMNKNETGDWKDALFRIDYSEAGEYGYEANMLVSIVDLPVADPLDNPYSMSTLKMFAGKSGDVIDVYGNSNHPNATFFTGDVGFNWAFVASGNDNVHIGVAEVGLPPSNLDEPGRDKLLNYYSIQNVFTREIYALWPNISQKSIDAFLYNTGAPGYFDQHGFVQGGASPGPDYDQLAVRLTTLSPYNPKEIADLEVSFK